MVLLHFKNADDKQFLYETTVEATVDDTLKDLCTIHNLRMLIGRLKIEGEELAKHGPCKPLDKQGLDDYAEDLNGYKVEPGPHYAKDPTGRRTGNPAAPQVVAVLRKTLDEAAAAASKDNAAKKVPLTKQALDAAIDNVRGAVMICHPEGLPEWDPVRGMLEGSEDLAGTSYAADPIDAEAAALWFCGKQMQAGKKLAEHVGRNEKSKVVVKVTKKGAGAPSREPVIDQETHKNMLSWYSKKQQEQQALAEDDDDQYTNSAWANPKALKGHFAGVGGDIRIR
ncbi:unnamed protein product [Pedinophyceae sp. YPF-701]|nr:unnamed protein product [Pedinophyceae sp. YPF-701]